MYNLNLGMGSVLQVSLDDISVPSVYLLSGMGHYRTPLFRRLLGRNDLPDKSFPTS
jgi:hypothetical protein